MILTFIAAVLVGGGIAATIGLMTYGIFHGGWRGFAEFAAAVVIAAALFTWVDATYHDDSACVDSPDRSTTVCTYHHKTTPTKEPS